ncbi:MAG: YggT family protein [Clostridia bacterium]|nr:YggT family protein [Clostridia bacterium]
MTQITYVFANVAYLLVGAIQTLMFIRAILSWFPMLEENSITDFIYQVTEVVIYPVRCILERFEIFTALPLDLSFFVTFILLSILQTILMV